MFAATAATIVSGAVAERVKLGPFIIFSLIYVGFCYPVVGMWKWGGGFLNTLETPFYDFAGSTIVHTVGGWAALVGAFLLGPRIGKYTPTGMKAIPGHNIPMATMGVFLLWFGWFGFNGGSVLSADPGTVSRVFVTTSLAASAGAIGALLTSYIKFKTYDITMVLNGILAGLVGITAGADKMGVMDAVYIYDYPQSC
jgi:ammonium transporter, Amt family